MGRLADRGAGALPGSKVAAGSRCAAEATQGFRDRDEAYAAADLNELIKEALKNSRFLIVICSPYTPRSKWVSREIQMFNELGRSDNVLALLTEGEPNDSFPDAMLAREERIGEAQAASGTGDTTREPLAADVRSRRGMWMRQVKRIALLRLLARMLDVPFDDLRQRDREREIGRRNKLLAAAAAITLLIGTAGGLVWDRMRLKTAHYSHLISRWGVPEGFNAISGERYSHMETSFGVSTRRGKVIEARRERSTGVLVENDEGEARWAITYREDGTAEKIEVFDGTNRFIREDRLRRKQGARRTS
jgi:hypothetical protein